MHGEAGGKPVIGLIGGIGAGKSLVAQHLKSLGCAVIDADDLARKALDDAAIRDRLVAWWGDGVLDAGGRVDRRCVARIVFEDPEELARLEDLLHPDVHRARRELHARYQADPAVEAVVEDCPLLMEKGLDDACDVLIFVRAGVEQRRRRLAAARRWTPQDLDRRQKFQLPLDIKSDRADYVIDNDASADDCLSHVRCVFSQVLKKFRE